MTLKENPVILDKTVEKKLEDFFRDERFLGICRLFGWGKLEIVVHDGKPIMVSFKKDIKLVQP